MSTRSINLSRWHVPHNRFFPAHRAFQNDLWRENFHFPFLPRESVRDHTENRRDRFEERIWERKFESSKLRKLFTYEIKLKKRALDQNLRGKTLIDRRLEKDGRNYVTNEFNRRQLRVFPPRIIRLVIFPPFLKVIVVSLRFYFRLFFPLPSFFATNLFLFSLTLR